MKTVRSHTPSREHGPTSGLAGRIGTQLAAVLLAILVTPTTLPTRDAHDDATPAPDRSAAPRTRG